MRWLRWENIVHINVLHQVDELVFAIIKDILHIAGVKLEEHDGGTRNVGKSVGHVQNEVEGANGLIDGIVTQSSIYNIISEYQGH